MKQPAAMHPLLEPLTETQRTRLKELERLFLDLNQGLNLVSRQTAEDFERRHLLHSLCLAERSFPAGATVVDWGTGGGLPGLPLAIVFPETRFVLVDSTRKKIEAVATLARRLGLGNVEGWWGRAERWDGSAHYAVSRATAPLRDLWAWTQRVLTRTPEPPAPGAWRPGLLTLKGGDLREEIRQQQRRFPETSIEVEPLRALAADAYFDGKVLVQVRRDGAGATGGPA